MVDLVGRMDAQRLCVLFLLLCSVFSISQGQDECVDEQQWCEDWSQKGHCEQTSTYYGYMQVNCKKSCDLCAASSSGVPHRLSFFTYKQELGKDELDNMDQGLKMKLEVMTDVKEDAVFNNYPTRPGKSTDDHMCDKVLNYVPRHLTFITRYPYYQRYTHAYNIPIVSSRYVSDAAMKRACYVVRFMLADKKVLRDFMYKYQGRVGIIGRNEHTNGIPEHSFLPNSWNARARGLGGTLKIPISTGTEENLLCERRSQGGTDRYPAQDIFLHEFSHGVQEIAVRGGGIPGYYSRLKAAYYTARSRGLWARTYSMSTVQEYFAEATQSYFWVNSYAPRPDGVRGPINTREKLARYDPRLYALIKEVFPCGNRILKRCDQRDGKKMIPFKMNCDQKTKPKPKPKPKPEPTSKPEPVTEDPDIAKPDPPKPGERVDGGWGKWSEFTKCSKSCGGGTRTRTRKCDYPAPTIDGRPCEGDDTVTENCNQQKCEVVVKQCKNFHKHCRYWATKGFCTDPNQQQYMKENCPRACGLCTPSTSCKDKSGNCKSWGARGFCTRGSYVEYMKLNCKSTCGLC